MPFNRSRKWCRASRGSDGGQQGETSVAIEPPPPDTASIHEIAVLLQIGPGWGKRTLRRTLLLPGCDEGEVRGTTPQILQSDAIPTARHKNATSVRPLLRDVVQRASTSSLLWPWLLHGRQSQGLKTQPKRPTIAGDGLPRLQSFRSFCCRKTRRQAWGRRFALHEGHEPGCNRTRRWDAASTWL